MNKKSFMLIGGVAAGAGTVMLAKSLAAKRPVERVGHHNGVEIDEIAESYSRMTGLPPFQIFVKWLAKRALWGVQGGKVLDIGAGPGWLALEMARQSPHAEVVGVDPSDGMVTLAYQNLWWSPVDVRERMQFQRGEAELLPLPDHSFDLVVSTLALHHVKNPVRMFNEIARVLKPGGRFMVFDMRRDMGEAPWFFLWIGRNLAPKGIRDLNEPLASRDASYTPAEVSNMAWQAELPPWRVATGPFWLSLENMDTP